MAEYLELKRIKWDSNLVCGVLSSPQVAGGLPLPIWLDDKYNVPPLFNTETLSIVFPNSIVVTAVALIEVLVTMKLVDGVSRKLAKNRPSDMDAIAEC